MRVSFPDVDGLDGAAYELSGLLGSNNVKVNYSSFTIDIGNAVANIYSGEVADIINDFGGSPLE